MADRKLSYPGSSNLTFTSLASLGSSSTFVAGAESTEYDNSTNKYPDAKLSGEIKVGTSPTTATQILVYVVAEIRDAQYPDVFDGTDSAETVTSAGVRDSFAKLAAVINVDSTTTDRVYPFECGSIASLFGGFMPRKFVVFVAHNTGVALNASGHTVSVTPLYETIA